MHSTVGRTVPGHCLCLTNNVDRLSENITCEHKMKRHAKGGAKGGAKEAQDESSALKSDCLGFKSGSLNPVDREAPSS